MFYVRMTDSFMSGWGQAQGMTNVFVVACETLAQARQIESAAHKRPEMKRVAICGKKPASRSGVIYTHKQYADLSGPWLE